MKAIFNPEFKTKFTTSHRKEGKVEFEEYTSLTASEYKGNKASALLTLRLYYTCATAYACLWIHSGDTHTSGSGKAGGYGYHKGSAAASEAIKNAGFTLQDCEGKTVDINGVGDTAIYEAVEAIAESLHSGPYIIHKAHQ